MPKRRKVYKVVLRYDDGRRLSAMLPEHLAATYVDRADRRRTVPSSMAFKRLGDARWWASMWVMSEGMMLEVWEAEAEVIGPVRRVIRGAVGILNGYNLKYAKPNTIPRDKWAEAVAKVEAPGRVEGEHWGKDWAYHKARLLELIEGRQSLTISSEVPAGAIHCTDLKLVRRVYHPISVGYNLRLTEDVE